MSVSRGAYTTIGADFTSIAVGYNYAWARERHASIGGGSNEPGALDSRHRPVNEPADFSLVLGGPLYQLWRRTRLAGDALQCCTAASSC